MKKLIISLAFIALTACGVSGDDFARIMRQEGISNFRNEGYAVFGCSDSDTFKTRFSGTKNGQPIKGVVCGGWLKGYTVRYF
jgi:hypothetical protein